MRLIVINRFAVLVYYTTVQKFGIFFQEMQTFFSNNNTFIWYYFILQIKAVLLNFLLIKTWKKIMVSTEILRSTTADNNQKSF